MRITAKCAIVAFVYLLAFACGEKSENESASDETETDAGKLELGAALADATPTESLNFVDEALDSIDQALEETAGSLVLELVDGDSDDSETVEQKKYASKYCAETGDPMQDASEGFASLTTLDADDGAPDGTMTGTHENYAARLFHCKLKVNSSSPDTPRGAYSTVNGILCAAENAGGLDWDNPGVKSGITIAFTDACFQQKFIDEMEENGLPTVKVDIETTLLEGDEWDRTVKIFNMEFNGEVDQETFYHFSFKNSKDGIGVKQYGYDAQKSAEKSGWAFSLDSDGTMRFERKSFVDPSLASDDYEDEIGTDFMRIMSKGSIETVKNDEGKVTGTRFTAVTGFEGLYSLAYDHPDAEHQGKTSATIATIKGTSDAGFETRSYACNNSGFGAQSSEEDDCDPMDATTWKDVSAYNIERGKITCFPRTKTCEGVEALEFGAGKEAMVMRESDASKLEKDPEEWITEMAKPLGFDSVTWDFVQE